MSEIRESGENYLETILELESGLGVVRSIDVAKHLCVSRPSVNKAMNILREAGMVEQERYGTLTLTEEGRRRAEKVKSRHELLFAFLSKVLGIDAETAAADACRIEHVVGEKTIEALTDFIKKQSKE
jgi:Mn-dependent transcriptional regulator